MINLTLSSKIFNRCYLDVMNDPRKYQIYYGGSGSGKSFAIAQRLVIKCCKSKRRMLIIRKTLVSQKDSCWKLILDVLSKWKILEYCKLNRSDLQIDFPNGSQMLFKGLDDPEKIKSITGISDVWAEEATELTETDFSQLLLRAREQNANTQFFLSFNPVSKSNWVYKRWFAEDAVVDTEDTMILKTTYKDNKFLPADYITTLENMIKTNPTYYKIYALGDFCTLDKLIFNNWHVEDYDYRSIAGTHCTGLDFGYANDINALTCSIAVEDQGQKKLYIYREWGDTGKTNPEIANIIHTLGLQKDVIICDSAEPKSIEELRRLGCRVKESVKGPDSVRHGIQLMQEYQIIIHPSCVQTIEEFQNYTWMKDRSGEYIDKPVDMFNHHIDSIRYSLQLLGKGKVKILNKSDLGVY